MTALEVLEAIRTLEEYAELKAELQHCDKVRDMVKVYEEYTQSKYIWRVVGVSREEVASDVARELIQWREIDRFKGLKLSEKWDYMKGKKWYENLTNLWNCSREELKEICELLGVEMPLELGKMEIYPSLEFLKEVAEAIAEAVK